MRTGVRLVGARGSVAVTSIAGATALRAGLDLAVVVETGARYLPDP